MSEFKPVENPEVVYTLNKPIRFLNDEITEIAMREPKGKDVADLGSPIKFDPRFDPPQLDFDYKQVSRMVSRLSGLPVEGTLDNLSPADLIGVGWYIARFFIPNLH